MPKGKVCMKEIVKTVFWCGKIILGGVAYALGFNMFLVPYGLNAGGVTGLVMALVHMLGFGSIGVITILINLPLFAIGGLKIGKKYFFGSLIGMMAVSVFIDIMDQIPVLTVEPVVASIYGGVLCGFGLGLPCSIGASTGGGDIVVRLLKLRCPNVPIGTINTLFDLTVAVLTGLAFRDYTKALYAGIAIYVSGQVIDMVVYRFDYSKVVLIVSDHYNTIALRIGEQLHRGTTFLHGQGSYTGHETKVMISVVKKQQVAEMKRIITDVDPNAFIVVQEAHQVLGKGFERYSRESL